MRKNEQEAWDRYAAGFLAGRVNPGSVTDRESQDIARSAAECADYLLAERRKRLEAE